MMAIVCCPFLSPLDRLFWIDRFAYQIVRKRRDAIAEMKKERATKGLSSTEDEADSGFRDLLSLYINKGPSILPSLP
jgi:hypothetical protein